jgi:hypothetical protein
VLRLAGAYLHVQAQLTDAKALIERALAIDEGAHGPDHPQVARDLNNLASPADESVWPAWSHYSSSRVSEEIA